MRKRTVLLLLVPSVAVAAPVITEYVEIDKPASDPGKLSLEDKGTDYSAISPGSISNWFRLIRADGAGYISNNASFTGNSSGGYWTQDNSNGMSIIEEFGEGNWGVFLAPKNSQNPIGSSLKTVLNAEFTGVDGLTGPMVVQVPQQRLFIGKTKGVVPTSSIDAAVRVITETGNLRPLYVAGKNSTLATFLNATAPGSNANKALLFIGDSSSENDTGYVTLGIDPNGSNVGYPAGGGAFVSTGKNGAGVAQPLILHTYNSTDVVIAAGNSEKARFLASGNVGIGTATPSYKLHVAGQVAGTGWVNLSSRAFKEDIAAVPEAEHSRMLDVVMKMDLTRYKYKKEFGGDGTAKLGFIAEDMPKDVLSTDGKGVDVYELLAYTIGAMKAQQRTIEQLEAQLADLRKR